MLRTHLIELAKALNWRLSTEADMVFGDYRQYQFSVIAGEGFDGFVTSLAGLPEGGLQKLTGWLEKKSFPVRLLNYDVDANFLVVRAKPPVFSAVAKYKKFLDLMTAKFSELNIPTGICAVCGHRAESRALFMGLYATVHKACVGAEGRNFTESRPFSATERDDYVQVKADIPAFATAKENEGVNVNSQQPAGQSSAIDSAKISELASSMAAYREAFIDDTVKLCRIPSVKGTPTDDAPYGQETADALNVFLERGKALGFKTKNVDNRAGWLEMGQGDEMVACLCHLDVVPAGDGWATDPFNPRVENGRIIARGAADDKGPAVMVLYALKALMDDASFSPNRRLRLIVGLDEERGSDCMAHYVRHEEVPVAGFTADAEFPAIYAEKGIARIDLVLPRNGGEILKRASGGEALNMVAAKASFILDFPDGEVTIEKLGKPAHASTPELGENAITLGLADVAATLAKRGLNDPFVDLISDVLGTSTDGSGLGLAFEDESGLTTVNAGLLKVDDKEASIGLDIRYPVTFDYETAIKALIYRLEARDVIVRSGSGKKPLYLKKDSFLIKTLMKTFNEGTGMNEEPRAMGGGTYARSVPNIAAFGPAFPGDEHVAHQADEYIDIEKALAAAAIYRNALRTLAQG